jgi:hypothetical protein
MNQPHPKKKDSESVQLALSFVPRDEQLTVSELESEISRITQAIAKDAARLPKLRHYRGSKVGNVNSAKSRTAAMERLRLSVQQEWINRGGGRDAASKIAELHGWNERRVRRYVAPIRVPKGS